MAGPAKMEDFGQPRAVVVGGGFGGGPEQALARAPGPVVLLDQQTYHAFPPLLYQLAMAGLATGSLASTGGSADSLPPASAPTREAAHSNWLR